MRGPLGTRLRVRGALLRHTAALEQRTLALGFGVAAVGAVIAAVAWLSTTGLPFQGSYPFTVVVPASTPPIAKGAEVRIAGKIAGNVTSVQPSPTTLRVNAFLRTSFGPLGRGASIHVGVLLGTTLVYLVVSPGDHHHPLRPGTVIPESRVTMSNTLPQALETFDAATRAALARDITVVGEGWLGRGQQTNSAIADQRVDYTYGTPLLRALVPFRGVLADATAAAASVSRAVLGTRPDDNAAGTTASATFWQTLAARNRAAVATQRFGAAEQQLLQTLPAADQTIAAATDATRPLEALAQQIVAEDPDFVALFKSAPALVDSTRRFNRDAPGVLRGLIPTLDALREPALALPLIVGYGAAFGPALDPYASELNTAAARLIAVTSFTYAGKTALRVTGTIGCLGHRDPYPPPGQAQNDTRPC
jgi:ABC-type transporter Mla subunit MlaD